MSTEGTWTASTQPHSHIPSEKSAGKRLLFLNCSGIPVALHAAPFVVPREVSLIYGTAGVCAGLAFHFEVSSFVSRWSWSLCAPKASCYGVAVTKRCHSCPSSCTFSHIRLVLQLDCVFCCPMDWQILSSLPPPHQQWSCFCSQKYVLENLQQLCLSWVYRVFSFDQASLEPGLQPCSGRCCLSHGQDKTVQGKAWERM